MENQLKISELVYAKMAEVSDESRQQAILEGLYRLIWTIMLMPDFSEYEQGMLAGFLSSMMAMSVGLLSYEDAFKNLQIVTGTYKALAGGTELPPEGSEALEYYKNLMVAEGISL